MDNTFPESRIHAPGCHVLVSSQGRRVADAATARRLVHAATTAPTLQGANRCQGISLPPNRMKCGPSLGYSLQWRCKAGGPTFDALACCTAETPRPLLSRQCGSTWNPCRCLDMAVPVPLYEGAAACKAMQQHRRTLHERTLHERTLHERTLHERTCAPLLAGKCAAAEPAK